MWMASPRVLKKIAYQKGIGRILSQGVRHAATVWGMENEAIHVKGLEPAGFDPRVLKGMGLAYATSDRGACHLRATFYKSELNGQIDPSKIKGKAKLFVDYEDKMTLFDVLILCRFYRDLITWKDLQDILRYACDLKLKKSELKPMASSIISLARSFNHREGHDEEKRTSFPAGSFGKCSRVREKRSSRKTLNSCSRSITN